MAERIDLLKRGADIEVVSTYIAGCDAFVMARHANSYRNKFNVGSKRGKVNFEISLSCVQ